MTHLKSVGSDISISSILINLKVMGKDSFLKAMENSSLDSWELILTDRIQ